MICTLHGGPLHGKEFDLHPHTRRLQVPVMDGWGQCAFAIVEPYLDIPPTRPQFGVFTYVISLEQWPIPSTGPTMIGYPAYD